MRIVIAAGLGESGHQTVARAIKDSGRVRGHQCDQIDIWPKDSNVARDVIFGLYRTYSGRGLASMPSVLGSREVADALIADMMPRIAVPADVDVIIATHATDADILAAWAQLSGFAGRLVVVHTDFTPFPVRALDRADDFVGVIPSASASAAVRRRQRPLGMPVLPGVPSPLAPPDDRRRLIVTAGAVLSRSAEDLVDLGLQLADALPEAEVEVCLGRSSETGSRSSWDGGRLDGTGPRVAYHDSLTSLLASARLVVTKPSGATVAEATSLGAVPVLTPSVIPWERKAAGYLVQRGVAVEPRYGESVIDCAIRTWHDRHLISSAVAAAETLDLAGSADRLWQLLEGIGPRAGFTDDEIGLYGDVRRGLERAASDRDPLERTAATLQRLLDGHFDWNGLGSPPAR